MAALPVAVISFLMMGFFVGKSIKVVRLGLFFCTGEEEIRHGRARWSLWHQGEGSLVDIFYIAFYA